ncbi:uncharacterized protein LOC132699241 [Cylas formicarius]|uniref:uncharacterized protein LOC132699241 n=1 Tax=Cylas formicarius TaxID=197179 RepID=UPI002958C22F|nr:uncharacterized protein LOC132699241 [Cylas formicarius]
MWMEEQDSGEQSFVYLSENLSHDWTKEGTLALQNCHISYLELFENGTFKTKRDMYEAISLHLAKAGYNYTANQCYNKWRTMQKWYLRQLRKPSQKTTIIKQEPISDEEVDVCNGLDNEETRAKRATKRPAPQPPNFTDLLGHIQNNINKNSKDLNEKLDAHLEISRKTCEIHAGLLKVLESVWQNSDEVLELKRQKLNKQDEIINQMKIQNKLLSKIIEKINKNG